MAALIYIVQTLFQLYLLVLLLRLLLQWSDFRNPFARVVLQLTNPVILPLRRVLPPVGRFDTASIAAVVAMVLLMIALVALLGTGRLPPVVLWLQLAALALVRLVLYTYLFAIILYAVLSLLAQGTSSPAQSLLGALCEPVLRPFRRIIPSIAGIDLSPLWACIAIQAVLLLLPQ